MHFHLRDLRLIFQKSEKMKTRIIILVFFAILVFQNLTFAKDECSWVESKGYAVLENITPEQARELAKRRAQAEAIAKATGIEIKSVSIVKDFELEAELIKSFSKGVILKEEIIKWEEEKDKERPGSSFLTLHYRGCVKKIEGEQDPYFNVKLQMKENTYVEGDETYFKINCTKDCYITVFNITAENNVLILFPDGKYFKDNFLKENEDFEFPPKQLRDFGLKLRVKTLPKQKESTEIIWVVATKEKFDFYNLLCKKKEGRGFCEEKDFSPTLQDLISALSDIPLNQKSEDIEVYVVSKR